MPCRNRLDCGFVSPEGCHRSCHRDAQLVQLWPMDPSAHLSALGVPSPVGPRAARAPAVALQGILENMGGGLGAGALGAHTPVSTPASNPPALAQNPQMGPGSAWFVRPGLQPRGAGPLPLQTDNVSVPPPSCPRPHSTWGRKPSPGTEGRTWQGEGTRRRPVRKLGVDTGPTVPVLTPDP